MREMNPCKILARKPEGKRPQGGMGCIDWAQGRDSLWAYLSIEIKLHVP
jgi:hypothetical protein